MKTIHPFPARMAPDIVFSYLPKDGSGLRVLDPMAGSGTTISAARSRGFEAIGCDTDPLAVTIARANVIDLNADRLRRFGRLVLRDAVGRSKRLKEHNAYPKAADEETRDFIDYWFDSRARIELIALSRAIANAPASLADHLKCAFSRMIITKKTGVSLAEDVSHSRPHRTRNHPPVYPLEIFMRCVEAVIRAQNFGLNSGLPQAKVQSADCRRLPVSNASIDYIITSPPYLNAIDYLRGHKMTLVWFGYAIPDLRRLRTASVGTDFGYEGTALDHVVEDMVPSGLAQPWALRNRLRRYVMDLDSALREMRRVLVNGGECVLVIGDCTIKGCDVFNSVAVDLLAKRNGFARIGRRKRKLRDDRRYLPPPSKRKSGRQLTRRMWNEIILRYQAQ